jgi:hypothetical protein
MGKRERLRRAENPDRVTTRVACDHASSHAIITPRSLELARRQDTGDLLEDPLPRRLDQ